jgi:hypothetical protein
MKVLINRLAVKGEGGEQCYKRTKELKGTYTTKHFGNSYCSLYDEIVTPRQL